MTALGINVSLGIYKIFCTQNVDILHRIYTVSIMKTCIKALLSYALATVSGLCLVGGVTILSRR